MDHERLAPAIKPVASSNRFNSIDTLRGFALLGILVPNIVAFAWPMAAMTNPEVISDSPANDLVHTITATGFLGKFMFIFALLFGSGVVMYARKYDTADESGNYHTKLQRGASLWYSRCAWLLFFGMLHAYLFWYGDILTFYALAGLTLLWWIRRINPKVQFFAGLTLYYLGSILMIGFSAFGYWALREGHIDVHELSADPAVEIAGYSGTFIEAMKTRFFMTLIMQLTIGILFLPLLWGIMSMGMGLTRMGILTGQKSMRFYVITAAICLGLGIPLTAASFYATYQNFTLEPGFMWQSFAQPAGVPLAFGYAAFVIALSKWAPAKIICIPLAAVGRMALTNYFLHTILCTTFFYGYGMGYFATIEYPTLWLVVFSVWAINIAFSLVWLQLFTMGPFEWIWRCLTYRQLVPIRHQITTS